MTNAAPANTNSFQVNPHALNKVKERFLILPSRGSCATFRDVVTGIDQGYAGILKDFYKKSGGNNDIEPGYLLGCLDYLYGEGFQPNGPKILRGGLYNTWQPHNVNYSGKSATAADVPLFLDYMERMFSVESERQYMMWWLAHAIRCPEQKIIATPVLRSRQGIGKTFMVGTLMRGIMGSSADVCALSDIVGTFQDAIIGKTTLLIDECYVDKRRTTNVLKVFQSNETLMVNRKNLPVITIENKLNLIIASNDFDPVYFESSDRRFFIPQFIEYKIDQPESKRFIEKFANWLTGENGFQKVRDYLEGVNLSEYSPYDPAIMTESKQARLGWSLDDKISEQIEKLISKVSVINVSSVKTCLTVDSPQPLSDRKIAACLEQAGCISKRTDSGVFHITPYGVEQGFTKETAPKALKDAFSKLNLSSMANSF